MAANEEPANENNFDTLITSGLHACGLEDYETDGGQQQQQVTENKMVAVYKHVGEEGLHMTVDPTTKKLAAKPSERLREYLKNAGPSTTVAQLITNGVFFKIGDCMMEVKKVKK